MSTSHGESFSSCFSVQERSTKQAEALSHWIAERMTTNWGSSYWAAKSGTLSYH